MKPYVLVAALATLVAAPPWPVAPARAMQWNLESRSYLPIRESTDSNIHAPFYEYLSLGFEDLAAPGVFLRAGGWGRADLAEQTYDDKTAGNLDYAEAGWRAPRWNSEFRLGRVTVTGGVARQEVLDGAALATGLPFGFDLSGWAGVPVETDDTERSKDSLYGGRLSQGMPGIYRVGASYLKEKDDDADAREEAGVDFFLRPGVPAAIEGTSLYNAASDAWARHDWRLTLGPFWSALRVSARYRHTDYAEFFTAPGTTALSFPALDPHEVQTSVGGEVELTLPAGVTLSGDYTAHSFDIADAASTFGARADWAGAKGSAGASWHRTHGSDAELQYDAYEAYGAFRVQPVDATLSGQYVRYEEKVNDMGSAAEATLTLGWNAAETVRVAADASYGVNPAFDYEVKGMLRLILRLASAPGKGGAAK